MGITYEDREVWRGRGRPPREPSPGAMTTCQQTARDKSVARRQLGPEVTEKDVRDLIADLRAAERKLGGKVHIQRRDDCVRWFWEPPRGGVRE